jgi:hypothetical protein
MAVEDFAEQSYLLAFAGRGLERVTQPRMVGGWILIRWCVVECPWWGGAMWADTCGMANGLVKKRWNACAGQL